MQFELPEIEFNGTDGGLLIGTAVFECGVDEDHRGEFGYAHFEHVRIDGAKISTEIIEGIAGRPAIGRLESEAAEKFMEWSHDND